MVGKAERLTWHKAWTMVSTVFSISYTSRICRASGMEGGTLLFHMIPE
nr:hypothetical protein [uncultured bacterium]